MKVFTDSQGRDWTVAIDVSAIKRVRDLIGLDLLSPEKPFRDGQPAMACFDLDLVLLIDCLYVICKPQADSRGVKDEQFGQALGGEAIAKARIAFFEELSDFFRQLGRAHLAAAIAKQMRLVQATIDHMEAQVNAVDVEQVIQTHGAPSTSSPVSSA